MLNPFGLHHAVAADERSHLKRGRGIREVRIQLSKLNAVGDAARTSPQQINPTIFNRNLLGPCGEWLPRTPAKGLIHTIGHP